MNEFDEEADESHDSEADGCRQRDLGKLFPIRFRTPVQIGEETLKALAAICGDSPTWLPIACRFE